MLFLQRLGYWDFNNKSGTMWFNAFNAQFNAQKLSLLDSNCQAQTRAYSLFGVFTTGERLKKSGNFICGDSWTLVFYFHNNALRIRLR